MTGCLKKEASPNSQGFLRPFSKKNLRFIESDEEEISPQKSGTCLVHETVVDDVEDHDFNHSNFFSISIVDLSMDRLLLFIISKISQHLSAYQKPHLMRHR